MIFSSSKCPLTALVAWCRTLHHSIGAGLPLVRIFKILGKSGARPLRWLARILEKRLIAGSSLEDALEPHRDIFPPMFLEMVAVGEQTGRLEDTFRELERYYEASLTTQRNFRSQMIYPLFQYVAAILILAFLYFILGFLAETGKAASVDPLGLGLTGASGAVLLLVAGFGLLGGILLVLKFAANNVQFRSRLEGMALILPGWGPALLSFALQRFSVALQMCVEAGMRAEKTVHYCFRATCNTAFMSGEERALEVVKRGDELSEAVQASRAPFPDEFTEMLRMGEETGNMTEVMERLAERYREESQRRMKTAAQVTSYAIYAMVAIMIIIAIFKIAGMYIGALNKAAG
jgi:type II secretory pathway component PulF